MDEKQRRRLSLVMWAVMFLLVCGLYVGQIKTGRREFKVNSHKWDKLLLVLEQIEKLRAELEKAKALPKDKPVELKNVGGEWRFFPADPEV